MNIIKPYKEREIDYSKPVIVYRRLSWNDVIYSVKQKGLVVGHATYLFLESVSFRVNKSGQKKAREKKQRNVHAFAVGRIIEVKNFTKKERVSYNPFKFDTFYNVKTLEPVYCADKVLFDFNGLYKV